MPSLLEIVSKNIALNCWKSLKRKLLVFYSDNVYDITIGNQHPIPNCIYIHLGKVQRLAERRTTQVRSL